MKPSAVVLLYLLTFLCMCNKTPDEPRDGAAQTYFVTATSLNLRTQPSRSAPTLAVLQKDDPVSVVGVTGPEEVIDGTKGKWVKAVVGYDKEGFLFGGYTTKATVVKDIQQTAYHPQIDPSCHGEEYTKCLVTANERLSKERPDLISYKKDALVITAKNGKKKLFKRMQGGSADSVQFPVVHAVYADIGYVHVSVSYYEGGTDHLVNVNNGVVIDLIAPPHPSPDKKRFLAATSAIAYSTPGLQIVNVEGPEAVNEFYTSAKGSPMTAWLYTAEWENATTIDVIRYVMVPGGFAEQKKTMKWLDGKWRMD